MPGWFSKFLIVFKIRSQSFSVIVSRVIVIVFIVSWFLTLFAKLSLNISTGSESSVTVLSFLH